MFGSTAVFIVVVVYWAVVLMFAGLLAPRVFVKLPLTGENIAIGLLSCLLIALCTWMILVL
ncbi:hypothetical protein LCGC14_1605020 [marine sediment metagenome]|uniref:Uncharacterized protein n=1 Tax=marine sediment metagenome TaxID=412755 RepID=A0A0F9IA01_9ZZZZ